MEEQPYLEIESVDRDLLKAAAEFNGRQPDNFVDSSEGSLPNLSAFRGDPGPAGRLVEAIDAAVEELVEEAEAEVAAEAATGKDNGS